MRRWGWIFALLVSVGLNAGILATLWVTRATSPVAGPQEAPALREPAGSGPRPIPGAPPSGSEVDPRREPREPRPEGPSEGREGEGPVYPPRPQADPRRPLPAGPPLEDEGPFGGETAEVGPEPGEVGPVPSAPTPRLREFADRLGISGATRERFFALQLRMIATLRAGRWRIQQLRREVRIEMFSERPDRQKIEANLAAIQAEQLALERQTARTILDTREVLDGEAERRYLEMITRMRLGSGEARPNRPMPRREGALPAVPPRPRLEEAPGAVRPGPAGQSPPIERPLPGAGARDGGFERPRPGPRGGRLTPRERLERRRRFEEWRARQEAGTTDPPSSSDPEGEAPPPLD